MIADLCSRLPEFNDERLQAAPAPIVRQVSMGGRKSDFMRRQEAEEIFSELERSPHIAGRGVDTYCVLKAGRPAEPGGG